MSWKEYISLRAKYVDTQSSLCSRREREREKTENRNEDPNFKTGRKRPGVIKIIAKKVGLRNGSGLDGGNTRDIDIAC